MYFLNAHAALIVYDVTDKVSFEKCKTWVKFLEEFNGDRKPGILKYLVGNKSDMDSQKQVSISEGSDYAKSIDA